ncbi:hypothetical protein DV735_g4011, partial [Chaetothyriales sp. CBS 134920]
MAEKKRVLLIGSGGIGTITALNLELSGECAVTAVLRSNYNAVKENGFQIDAADYGKFKSWRPSQVLNRDGEKKEKEEYDYVICTTKNTPDVPPPTLPLVDLIRPAVTPGHSVIVLIQNGINIEKPVVAAFPRNVVLSGISCMGANELRPGVILQNEPDLLGIAPEFVRLYNAAGKAKCSYDPDLQHERWRKLLYNCVWNPIAALTNCDTGRLRLVGLSEGYADVDPVVSLVRPAMKEVIAVAASVGVTLDPGLIEGVVEADELEVFCVPSMLQDARKGRPMEVETILGEVTRTADRNGVPVPVIKVLYVLLKAKQWWNFEANGLIDLQASVEKRKRKLEEGK